MEQRRGVKHAAPFLLYFLTFWWLWQLLVGEWGRYQWEYGAGAAVVSAVIAELAVTRAGSNARAALPLAIIRATPTALGQVLIDFGIVMRALVQRRAGVFRTTRFAHPDTASFRAWATIVGDYSPNAYIVDVSDGETTSHHLVVHEPSQEPA